MNIGLVKEIKNNENRVALTPGCVSSYIEQGHKVYVQNNAGLGSDFTNEEYKKQGAIILDTAKEVFDISELIIKVKEPIKEEYDLFKEGQSLFTYLHLASDESLTKMLLAKKIKAVAYETITDDFGRLPCLTPMSEIAGRLSTQEGAKYLEKPFGGRGVLLGGVSGTKRGEVVILGGGVVGLNACKMAVGLGANVTVLDISSSRLGYFDDIFSSRITTLFSNRANLLESISKADLLIGAVLIPGFKAPKLVKKEDLKLMKKHSVAVDVAIDQGGCFESSRATTYSEPSYYENCVLHYCVANMPGAVPITSTMALTSSTINYGLELANKGIEEACKTNKHLKDGLNTYDGKCTNKAVADSLKLEYCEFV